MAAVAEDGTIGDGGSIPWHHPEDLRHFRRTTMGAPVIMGRRTYEAIVDRLGHALDGRTNVVLTGQKPSAILKPEQVPDEETAVHVAGDLEEAVSLAASTGAPAGYVVGGASVYEQTMSIVDRLVITEVPGEFDGDARFPPIDPDRWTLVDRQPLNDLSVATYRAE